MSRDKVLQWLCERARSGAMRVHYTELAAAFGKSPTWAIMTLKTIAAEKGAPYSGGYLYLHPYISSACKG